MLLLRQEKRKLLRRGVWTSKAQGPWGAGQERPRMSASDLRPVTKATHRTTPRLPVLTARPAPSRRPPPAPLGALVAPEGPAPGEWVTQAGREPLTPEAGEEPLGPRVTSGSWEQGRDAAGSGPGALPGGWHDLAPNPGREAACGGGSQPVGPLAGGQAARRRAGAWPTPPRASGVRGAALPAFLWAVGGGARLQGPGPPGRSCRSRGRNRGVAIVA